MNKLVPMNQKPIQAVTAPTNVPLGTAAWQKPGSGAVKTFEHGDFFLGYDQQDKALGVHDDRHSIVNGGTRGGKGAGVIIQNLLLWKGSAVVIDPKGENAMITARHRGFGSKFALWMGQKVRILDPFDSVKTEHDDFKDLKVCFNPLGTLHADREESVDDAARIAEALIVSDNSSDPFWDDSARIALKGIILHVATWQNFLPPERNLNTVRQLIMGGDIKAQTLSAMANGKKAPSPFQLLFKAMQRNKAFGGAIANAGGMLADLEKNSPRTLAGIMQTVRTNTEFLDSPAMKRCVAKSDFDLKELKTARKGATLYLCLPQRFVDTHYRWLRMMVTLTVTEMEQTRSMPACGHRVLMVLDEFPALKRMRVIENAAAQIAGFGVKLMFATQTLSQLKELYKDNWETILANCGLKLFFAIDDNFSRDYISKLVGDTEVIRTGRNASGTQGSSTTIGHSLTNGESFSRSSGGSNGLGSFTYGTSTSESHSVSRGTNDSLSAGVSESVQRRPLITPDEVGRLFGDLANPTALALISGQQPLFIKRKYYFRELILAGYYDPHPDHPLPMTIEQANAKRAEAQRVAEARKHEADQARAKELQRKEDAKRDRLQRTAYLAAQRQADYEIAERRRKGRRDNFLKYSSAALGACLIFSMLFL